MTAAVFAFVLAIVGRADAQTAAFDLSQYIREGPSTLSVLVAIQSTSGNVLAAAQDTGGAVGDYTWEWGDGDVTVGPSPQEHFYSDVDTNYVVKVTAYYGSGSADSREAVVWFAAPVLEDIQLPPCTLVSVPSSPVALEARWPWYAVPQELVPFSGASFPRIPRHAVEQVLSISSGIQWELTEGDVRDVEGCFEQVVLRHPGMMGMYPLWYTVPVGIGAGDWAFGDRVEWSSLFHEMGHNYTLNCPAAYHLGGRIDGPANAICSESLAQIFQHVTACEVVDRAELYGLDEGIVSSIKESAISSIGIVVDAYRHYVATGCDYASWNDPGTPADDTFDTFMVIAYQFFAQAERSGIAYNEAAFKMMRLLRCFNEDLHDRYEPWHDAAAADTFRATFMVSSLSYAFSSDLRSEFRSLGFPISDSTHDELLIMVQDQEDGTIGNPTLLRTFPNPADRSRGASIKYFVPSSSSLRLAVHDVSGRRVATIADGHEQSGWHEEAWFGRNDSGEAVAPGVYFLLLETSGGIATEKLVFLE